MYSDSSPKAKRIEFRCPDPSCNPYLAFAAMMMAGLDGIQNKIDPGDPLDKDIYDLPPEELKDVPHDAGLARRGARRARDATTSSCSRATSSPQDVIDDLDRATSATKEVDPIRLRPHPYEFVLYYDI